MTDLKSFHFEPIGVIETCFKEKFGIPRQPGLVQSAQGVIKLKKHPFFVNATKELEKFSHLWVLFVFHQHDAKNWKPSIRPPRLGGAKKVGVFASRSPHRPNPIGMSVVKLDQVTLTSEGTIEIHVRGVDILDGSPVLDIKPYLPYADSVPEAVPGWASEPIQQIPVEFLDTALHSIREWEQKGYPGLKVLIQEMLQIDPRPAFQKRQLPVGSPQAEGTKYGFNLLDFDVKWQIVDGKCVVLGLHFLK